MAEIPILDAVKKALADSPPRKFPETVDLAINLKDIDLSVPKNRIEEDVPLPKGRGRIVKITLFASDEMATKAKDAADFIFKVEQLTELAGDKKKARKLAVDCAYFLAEAPLMPTIAKALGTVLGPRGKMPRPIPPGANPAAIIQNLRNTVRIRTRDKKTFHLAIGNRTMSPEDLTANIEAVLSRLEKRLERGRQNIGGAFIKTSMGKAVRII